MGPAERELKLTALLDKHQAWLRAQPEWADLMTTGTRQQRRRAAELLAKELLFIPTATPGPMNRKMRREIWKALGGFNEEGPSVYRDRSGSYGSRGRTGSS